MNLDQERATMFAAIGAGITAWTRIETDLALLFGACCSPSFTGRDGSFFGGNSASLAVFHSTDGLAARLNMLGAAIEVGFPPDAAAAAIRRDWSELREVIQTWSKKRNYLAHWAVLQFDGKREGTRYRLVPPLLNHRQRHEGYTIRNVEEWARQFHRISSESVTPLLVSVGRHHGIKRQFADQLSAVIHGLRSDGSSDEAAALLQAVSS